MTSPEPLEKQQEPEKMDVEDVTSDMSEQNKITEAVLTETTVEEVTDTKEIDAPILEAEPIVIEKTDENETGMETETVEVITTLPEDKSKSEDIKNEDKAPVAEETPPMIITEIEELPDDKNTLGEVADIIEDLEPVVEEPPAIEEMDELQNVGEVLEKECDEILSKVQDVTNLDNIPIKPLLNTIAEETMETENTDSNDIVDRILDTEMELAMKPCEEVEVNKASDVETQSEGEIPNKEDNTADKVPDENPTECVKESKDIENINDESSPKETGVDNKVEVQESNTESLENKTEAEEVKEQTKEKHIEEKSEEKILKVENTQSKDVEQKKIEVDESKTMTVENTEENQVTREAISREVESKTEVVENKTEIIENENDLVENKVEVVENITEVVENKTEIVENKTDTGVVENRMEVVESKAEAVEKKMEVVESKTEEVQNETHVSEVKTDIENTTAVTESKEELKENIMEVEDKVLDAKNETDKPTTESQKLEIRPVTEESTEVKEIASVTEEVKPETEVIEVQVNGKATNGDSETTNLNGDVSQAEELSSRLSVENGKEEVNGSNGVSNDVEQGQGDNKMETEISDIKVKSVASDEPRTDPIDQPTEA